MVNDSGDADYHKGLRDHDQKYSDLVTETETLMGPTHFIVNVTHSGTSGFVANPVGAGVVTFNQKDLDLTDGFPRFFAGMVGVPMNDTDLKNADNFNEIARQVMPDDGHVFPLPA